MTVRRRGVGLLVAMATLLVGAGMPAGARATVTNVAPLNGSSEPIVGDTITDDQEIWAYVTSPSGGVVCIHRAVDAPAGCDGESDAYAETPILPFFAGFVPIQAGNLRSGDYVLVGAEAAGHPATAVSGEFSVVRCDGCPPPDLTKHNDFAVAAGNLLNAIDTTCSLVQAASMLWRTKGVYEFAQIAIAGVGSGLSVGMVMTTALSGGEAVYDVAKGDDLTAKLPGKLGAIADGICKATEKLQKLRESTLGHWAGAWAADPPDPAFSQVSAPGFTDFGAIAGMPDYGFNADRDRLDHMRAYAESSLHAFERYQGATAAGTMAFRHAQARETGEDLLGFANTLRRNAGLIEGAAAQMRSEFPDAADRTVTQDDLDTANTYVDRVRTSGYTAAEVARLHELGLNDDGIARLRIDQTIADPGDATPGTIDDSFDALATQMRELATLAEAFAADAWTFAGRSDTPPVADFSEGAHEGAAGRTVPFTDTATSPDLDPVTVTYDFGDGETATSLRGETIRHTFPGAGPYTVTETVRDDYASSSKSREVTAGFPNVAPVASFTVSPQSGVAPLQVHVDGSGSHDPDGTIASYAWDFGDGTTATGATADHTYDTPQADAYVLRLTVTDDRGGTDTTTKDIHANTVPNSPPVASFTATPQSGDGPLEVEFDAGASHDEDGTVNAYAWDFGDGETGSGPTLKHVYTGRASPYVARLTVTDDHAATDSTTRSIDAHVVAHAPAPADDALDARPSGALDVLANDVDVDADALRVSASSQGAHGTVDCAPLGGCLYVAHAGYTGPDEFTYTARDPGGLTATGKVTVTVGEEPAAGPPVARDDAASTRQGTAVQISVLANDAGTAPLTVADATQPHHGTATCTPAGTCSYTPAAGFAGDDGFRYTVQNADELTSTAEVHVTVAALTAAFGVTVAGGPDPVASGQDAGWGVSVAGVPAGTDDDALGALARPVVKATTTGAHAIDAASVRTAPGWTAEQVGPGSATARAGAGALLGEADTQLLARPLPPTSQGTGGDGYVPILVGQKVFAFFHHTTPTSVTCIDRTTGSRCPGYPLPTNVNTNSTPGPGAVVGQRIYVHVQPATTIAQSAPLGLFCWDAERARPCGYVVVDRLPTTGEVGGSAPVLVGGKLYLAGDGGRLFCVDPATNRPCATPALATGLAPDLGGTYDVATHGTRVFVARAGDKVACVDVAAAGPCPGWAPAKPLPADGRWNLVNRFDAAGHATGVCLVGAGAGTCLADADPSAPAEIDWLSAGSYGTDTEAETGTRTLVAGPSSGMDCWDWKTLAPCTGGGYGDAGGLRQDVLGASLPWAYGVAWDGSCAVGLGDPGLVFTVDPAGSSPCSSLGDATRTIDLRDQRCDGGVGSATWDGAALQDASAAELTSVVLTVRDAATGAVLATKDLTAGDLDLSGIDAGAHPAVTIVATARSAPGDAAWADAVPPRIRIAWHADPRQLCFRTRTAASCDVAPVAVKAALGDVVGDRRLGLTPTGCPPAETPKDPAPVAEPPAKAPASAVKSASELVLGCSDRRVVLEDVFADAGKVRLLGVADRRYAGQKVQFLFGSAAKPVGSAVVGADGRFAATAPLPPARLRTSNAARYVAAVGAERSLALKLARRMIVTRVTPGAGKVTIAGRVVGPLAPKAKDRRITLQRVVACRSAETLTTFAPSPGGAFAVTVKAPAGQQAAVYRLFTSVRATARSRTLTRTYTLPRAVDFR